ncbi:MAG: hypothetical protein EOM20_21560 [Spartobacteria bacterium]|nr:hypothetical protein [Spartobacteria bacterium]
MNVNARVSRLEQSHRAGHAEEREAELLAFWAVLSCGDLDAIIEAEKAELGTVGFDLDDEQALQAEVRRLESDLGLPAAKPSTPVEMMAGVLANCPTWERVWRERIQDDHEAQAAARAVVCNAGLPWPF